MRWTESSCLLWTSHCANQSRWPVHRDSSRDFMLRERRKYPPSGGPPFFISVVVVVDQRSLIRREGVGRLRSSLPG